MTRALMSISDPRLPVADGSLSRLSDAALRPGILSPRLRAPVYACRTDSGSGRKLHLSVRLQKSRPSLKKGKINDAKHSRRHCLKSRRAAGGTSVKQSLSSPLPGETCSSACGIHGNTGSASAPQSRVRGWTALK